MMSTTSDRGTSLFEVVLAMGIFTTVLVGIMQALISTRNYVGEDEIRNDLELESLRVFNEFSNDLGNSAWFQNAPVISPSNNEPDPKADSPETYPNVGKGLAGLGTTDWGDQIDFVRLRTKDSTKLSPYELRNDGAHKSRINLTQANAVNLDQFLSANAVSTLIVNENWLAGTEDPYVWPVFEAAVANLTFDQNRSFANPARSPRLYRYIVRQQANSQSGRLVRQYSNGPGSNYAAIPEHPQVLTEIGGFVAPPAVGGGPNPWVDDVILSDNVKATNDPRFADLVGTPGLRFDTILTDPTLGQNQVRITLILVRQPGINTAGVLVRRMMQTSVSMRSITFE
jgi:hypothetical protein